MIPINPTETEVEGHRAYASVLDVPEPIDMATIYVPGAVGVRVMDDLVKKGIPEVWLNPGADDRQVVEKARAARPQDRHPLQHHRHRRLPWTVLSRSGTKATKHTKTTKVEPMHHREAVRRAGILVALWIATAIAVRAQAPATPGYFPPRGEWRKQEPAALGLDKTKLDEAIAFAVAHENPDSKDLAVAIPNQFRNEAPYNTLIGPTRPRGGSAGIVIRHGSVAAEWGDTARADMTFSVTKTFLSTVVGTGLRPRPDPPRHRSRVAGYMPRRRRPVQSEHNAPITWEHLLRQTSDWSGTLWGKPDWADRPPRARRRINGRSASCTSPARLKYNDTRVNVLALAALYVLRRPLPTS